MKHQVESVRTTLLVSTAVTSSSSASASRSSRSGTTTATSGVSEVTRVGTSGCSDQQQHQLHQLHQMQSDAADVDGVWSSSTGGGSDGRCGSTVHPAAMALRLRVTQVVCGILTCVVGATAFIEERGQLRLGSGVVAGAATVVASVASIYVTTFDTTVYYDRVRWITAASVGGSGSAGFGGVTGSGSDMDRTSCVLSTLWALAVVSNLAMLAFVLMVFTSSSSTGNLIIIGSLELGLGTSVLLILVVNLCLALHYKHQLMHKN